jgi:uncharacterized protein (DUF1499 family)
MSTFSFRIPKTVWRVRWSVVSALAILTVFGTVLLGIQMGLFTGKRPVKLGLHQGQLAPVSKNSQNAVSSFAQNDYSKIAPLAAAKEPRAVFARLNQAVKTSPGAKIVTEDANYIYAEFTTPLLKFVDDVEFLLDEGNGVIHVRSASRLGLKDFGVNRKRIESLRQAIQTRLS